MQKKYLIGVDLGTSATKAALYQIDGKLVAEASQEVPLYYPRPGVVEQDNEDFYTSAAATVRTCIESSGIEPNQVAAIAFDSQMAGVGLIDEEFRPVSRFDSWLDMRCRPYIEWMDKEAGDRITQLTGCPPTCDHGPKMLWWKHEEPETYKRTRKFVMPGTYVAGKLAGIQADQAFIDYTYIHFTGFSDARKAAWSEELCDRFGLDMDRLPRIIAPCDIIGEVSEQSAREFGLAAGTIIAAGAGDTAANALGAGIVRPGMLFDVAGTAAVLAACTDQFVADTQHRALLTMHSIVDGLWHPLAYIGGGGLVLRWFRDQFFSTSRGETIPSTEETYAQMIALAESVAPGSDGLFFSPHLGGRICPSSPEMRGAWVGASWSHTQAHFSRAILESVAYEYAYYLRILKEILPRFELTEARVVGGGARSAVWNQIKADVLNVQYQQLQGNEFGTWGAAMIAGKAAGVIDDLAMHAEQTAHRDGEAFLPSLETHATYLPLIEKYIVLEEAMQHFFAG
ncbi:MAG TPA: FGGY family carbohydrate kinase [Anaerolineales bacterium]|nr:FGGY family carbohydrate kinase [Anaerolineales bacterium]